MNCVSNYVKFTNWTLNFNYWTGGKQQGCWGEWGWCSSSGVDAVKEGLIWSPNQPDNQNGSEGCLHLRVFKNGSGVALSDRRCLDKYIMACEVVAVKNSKFVFIKNKIM